MVRSGQTPTTSFVLTGSANLFERMRRAQVQNVSSPPSNASLAALIASGRRLFLKETFAGNGRACGTCHVESNNFTIDPAFIATLPASDPLFIAETNPMLATLERPELMRSLGLILVNADGFDNLAAKFALRSTQNVQALGNSTVRPLAALGLDFTGNGRNPDPPERLGWGQDAPALRDFPLVAIVQHATKSLSRTRGIDFRLPSDEELDALAAYQLPLGRQEDFNLTSIQLNSALAMHGKTLYLDTGSLLVSDGPHKNCNACHFNGGGTSGFVFTPGARMDANPRGFNMAAPTNVNETPVALNLGAKLPRDGGFGLLPLQIGSFGNTDDLPEPFGHLEIEEFNTPPLVESADTAPFFHNHTVKDLESAVAFYGTPAFQTSPFSIGAPGGIIPVQISGDPNDPEVQAIAALLRVLNVLENIRSSINVAERGRRMAIDADARELAALALAETIDAIEVLGGGALAKSTEVGVLSARAHLLAARGLLAAVPGIADRPAVDSALVQAVNRMRAARTALANEATLPPSFQN